MRRTISPYRDSFTRVFAILLKLTVCSGSLGKWHQKWHLHRIISLYIPRKSEPMFSRNIRTPHFTVTCTKWNSLFQSGQESGVWVKQTPAWYETCASVSYREGLRNLKRDRADWDFKSKKKTVPCISTDAWTWARFAKNNFSFPVYCVKVM